jgi:hypothetical protein
VKKLEGQLAQAQAQVDRLSEENGRYRRQIGGLGADAETGGSRKHLTKSALAELKDMEGERQRRRLRPTDAELLDDDAPPEDRARIAAELKREKEALARDEAEEYYYFGKPYYASLLEDLPANAQVFWAEKDGKAIAASIMLTANGRMNYHLSGSLKEYGTLAPTNLLLYKAALWGCANGFRTFYLGGGVGSGEDSLFKFKRAFYRGDLCRFRIGKKILNAELYGRLREMRTDTGRAGFFPEYRA